MYKYALILLFFGLFIKASAQEVTKIEPPFWWAGMKETSLQVLLYGKDLAKYELKLKPTAIASLKSIEKLNNPNYLFVNLDIKAAGTIDFEITNGKRAKTIAYKINKRENQNPIQNGVNASDVVYLLMPDRFANGDTSNDIVKGMNEQVLDRTQMYKRHGGDIQGLIGKLDYLKNLGVTAIWSTPLLENNQPEFSYHGYACTDLYKIDPRFGTNELYKTYVAEAHKKGMKVIMDYVHNHLGNQHWIIKDLPAPDWVNQWDTFTRSNYRPSTALDPNVSSYDKAINDKGWFDTHMPDINQKNPILAKYLIQNNIWWVEYAKINGYRLDTYPYPDQVFMANCAKALKNEYPDLSIVGEVWEQTVPTTAYFQAKNPIRPDFNSHLPSVTDFPFCFGVKDGLKEDFGWITGLRKIYYVLAQDAVYANPYENLIFYDNHDLSRFMSEIGEDLEKWKIAQTILFTMRGIPQMYYGTEIGMKNFSNPDGKVREDFIGGWPSDPTNKFTPQGRSAYENQCYNHIKTLLNIRSQNKVLHYGKLTQFIPDDNTWVYFRSNEKDTIMVAINMNNNEKMISTLKFKEMLSNHALGTNLMDNSTIDLSNTFKISPKSALIIKLK